MRVVKLASLVAVGSIALSLAWAQPMGGGQGPQGGGSGQPSARPQADRTPGARQPAFVTTAVVETRMTSITVAGRLEPARRIIHTAGIAGFVDEIHVNVGQVVREGQPLITIVRDAPGESYRPVVIAARIGGRVSELHLSAGAEVRAGASAATVIDDSAYRLSAALSDKDAFRVAALGSGQIVGKTVDGTMLKGSLVSVSAEPDYATGLFVAELRFTRQPGARLGTVLFVDLPVDAVKGTFIKRELLVRRFGRTVLWVVGPDDALKLIPVTTGTYYGDEVLIASGLQPGARFPSRITGHEKEGLPLSEYLETLRKGS